MSSVDRKKDTAEDAIKRRVNKMYENYGIDPNDADDSDLTRVYRYYKENPKQLDSDYKKSKKHAGQFSDEDTL